LSNWNIRWIFREPPGIPMPLLGTLKDLVAVSASNFVKVLEIADQDWIKKAVFIMVDKRWSV
jgi:hypothetical protein